MYIPLYRFLPHLLLLTSSLLLFNNCTKTDLQPSFIAMQSIEVATESTEGTANHDVTTCWLYVNDQSLGVYELPTTIPLLNTGTHTISINPGIIENGISSTRIAYPFFEQVRFEELNLVANETLHLTPVTRYADNTFFALQSDFEISNPFINSGTTSVAELELINDPQIALEGSRCLGVRISTVEPTFSIASAESYALPGIGTPVFLEMNYRCTQNFDVLLKAVYNSGNAILQPLITVNPKSSWNKIYINLTDAVSERVAQGVTQFQIVFKGSLTAETSQANYYWDNIKIVHQ